MTTKQSISIWKIILICALSLLAITAAVFTTYVIYQTEQDDYENRKHETIMFSNEQIKIVSVSKGYDNLYERVYDCYTNKPISAKFQWFASECSEGDSLVVYSDMKHKRGYLNLNTGELVIKGTYKHAWNFSEGLGAVVLDDKVGFVNPQGEWVIPCQFPVSGNAIQNFGFAFHDSLCVMTNEKDMCGLINSNGEWVLQPQYDCIWNPNEVHQRIFQNNGKYGLMDVTGQILLPTIYDDIYYDKGLYQLVKDGRMSTMDAELNVVNPFVCTGISNLELPWEDEDSELVAYSKEFVKFYINQMEGIMDASGKIIIPAKYYYIHMVSDQLFKAQFYESDLWILYDTKGNVINP